jgi:LacI family transcriptional regulator
MTIDAHNLAYGSVAVRGPSTHVRLPLGRKRVALIIETSLAPGREILRGIASYLREEGPWSIAHEPRSLEQSVPLWLRGWRGDGIIARVQSPRVARAIATVGVPTIDVLGVVDGLPFPVVHVDDQAIGQVGAEHLLDQGYRRFAFLGIRGENWSDRRAAAFARRVADAGFPCQTHFVSRQTARQESWEDSGPELAAWLMGLPRPTGLMIASDQLGPHTLEACRSNGIIVPDDLGVVGVDNDEPLCEVSDPPLSSVWPSHRQVGYEAARLLDALMRQQPLPDAPTLLPPRGVHARVSTDSLAVDDRNVARSLRFIREHACEDIEVDDVVRTVPISRSVLQRLFRDLLGRSIHDEIIRVRLSRARELLQETDLPLVEIAERAGFRHQEYMGAVFRQRLGITPGTLRTRKKRRARRV